MLRLFYVIISSVLCAGILRAQNVTVSKDTDEDITSQFLMFKVTPAYAAVIVNDESWKVNDGFARKYVPFGTYNYSVMCQDYITATGTITVNDPLNRHEINIELKSALPTSYSAVGSSETPYPASDKDASVKTFTVNGVSFNMIKVAGGTFQMGATDEQLKKAEKNERPVHNVTLSDFCIGETEVTQALWEVVMNDNTAKQKYRDYSNPVDNVSWHDCQAFIEKLNSLTGEHFRLPTEAEWEYAARGGNKSGGYLYSGSNDIDDVAWYLTFKLRLSFQVRRNPVMSKMANELGIYDMSGNVWEWCQDWYGSYVGYNQTNPTGPLNTSKRVFRGGSCAAGANMCRISYRGCAKPTFTSCYLGLRLAL